MANMIQNQVAKKAPEKKSMQQYIKSMEGEIAKALPSVITPERFMMTVSASELEGMAPAILQRKLNAYLKEALDGGQ